MNIKVATGSFAIALLTSAAALAQGNPLSQPPASMHSSTATQFSAADQKFIDDAAIGGMFEVQAGKLAEKSTNPQVRQFAARMVKDHDAADNQLKQIVTGRDANVPQQLDQQHQQTLDHLASLKGAEFDREYMQTMVKDHDEDAPKFADAAKTATDPRLKRFAQETLQTIQDHDRMAHHLAGTTAANGPRNR
ncbi:MAG: DUF4142 domain-containing protein [Alphaproteobacteria bacterium]|nr:DUF4142 domain-containing protein [Alphaproteobacteria bacterium]